MNETLSLPQIIERISQLTGADEQTVTYFIREFIDSLETSLSKGQSVKLKHFGHFFATSNDIRFIPEPSLAEAVNQPFAAFEAVELPDSISEETLAMLNAMSQMQVQDDVDQQQELEPEPDEEPDILDELHIPRQAYQLETEELEEKSLTDALLEIQGTKTDSDSVSTASQPSSSQSEESTDLVSSQNSLEQRFDFDEEPNSEDTTSNQTTETTEEQEVADTDIADNLSKEVEEEITKPSDTENTESETKREAILFDLESPVETTMEEQQESDNEKTQISSSTVNDNGTIDFLTSSSDSDSSLSEQIATSEEFQERTTPQEKTVLEEDALEEEPVEEEPVGSEDQGSLLESIPSTEPSSTSEETLNEWEPISGISSPSTSEVEEEISSFAQNGPRNISFDNDEEDLSVDISENDNVGEEGDIRFEDEDWTPSSPDDGSSPLLDENSEPISSEAVNAKAAYRPETYIVVESGGGIQGIDDHPYDTQNEETFSETIPASTEEPSYYNEDQISEATVSEEPNRANNIEGVKESSDSNFDVESLSDTLDVKQIQDYQTLNNDQSWTQNGEEDVEDSDSDEVQNSTAHQYKDEAFLDENEKDYNPDANCEVEDVEQEEEQSTTNAGGYPELKGYSYGHVTSGNRVILDGTETVNSESSETPDYDVDEEDYDDNSEESNSKSWLRWLIGILIAIILICGGLYLLERYGYGYNYVWSLFTSKDSPKTEQSSEGSTSIIDQSLDGENLDQSQSDDLKINITDENGQVSESEEVIEETPAVAADEEARHQAAAEEEQEKAKREAEEKSKAEAQEKTKREQEEQAKREQEKRLAQEKERAAAEADWQARQEKKAQEQRLAQQEREKAEADKSAQERNTQDEAQAAIDRRFANGPIQDVISPSRTLAMMAADYYGSSYYWVYIYQDNPYLGNPRQIMTGTKVNIPPLSKYVKGSPKDPKNIQKAISLAESINSMYNN